MVGETMYKKYPENYLFPVIIAKNGSCYNAYFPDLPGCIATADDFKVAMQQAKEALELHLWGIEQDDGEVPASSFPEDIELKEGQFLCYLDVNMYNIRAAMDNRSIKKTLTIPWYLNELAEKQHINFSQVLQVALKERLGIA